MATFDQRSLGTRRLALSYGLKAAQACESAARETRHKFAHEPERSSRVILALLNTLLSANERSMSASGRLDGTAVEL